MLKKILALVVFALTLAAIAPTTTTNEIAVPECVSGC